MDKSHKPGSEPAMDDLVVGSWLVQAGVITSDQLMQAIRFSKERSCTLREALISLRMLPSNAAAMGMMGQMPGGFPPGSAPAAAPLPQAPAGESPRRLGGLIGSFFSSRPSAQSVATEPGPVPLPGQMPMGQMAGYDYLRGGISGAQPLYGGHSGTPMYPAVANQELREVELRQSLQTSIEEDETPELTDDLFNKAIDSRATDIHLDPREEDYRVRYRVDGQLHDIVTIPYDKAMAVVSRIKLLANMDIVERRAPQDGRLSHTYGTRRHDLRVSTIPAGYGEKLVIRIHDAIAEIIGLKQLGLTMAQEDVLVRLLQKPNGMMIVSGPVGSGKTTTLYSFMGAVNSPGRNLMTIEDPIEYRLDGVNQVQVEGRAEIGFSEGLRAILRQDPDVIMIGEIRDHETAQIGLRAALTGVLVFSTTHASDASATIANLHNFSVPNYMLASGLIGIVGQRLVRKICPYCQYRHKPDPALWQMLGLPDEEAADAEVMRGQGCPACFHTGYLGRIGVFEILEVDEEIRESIMRKMPKDQIRQAAEAKGMQTLWHSVVELVRSGVTTIEEALRVVPM
jgi:type IV pilus assembly protein PilB